MENKNGQQMRAYREMQDADLFSEQWVEVELAPKEFPGYKGERISCRVCGEGINYERFVLGRVGETLCRGCAAPETRYYRPLGGGPPRLKEIDQPRCECP